MCSSNISLSSLITVPWLYTFSLKSEIEAKQLIVDQLRESKQDLVQAEQRLTAEKQTNASMSEEIARLRERVEQLESNQGTVNIRGK